MVRSIKRHAWLRQWEILAQVARLARICHLSSTGHPAPRARPALRVLPPPAARLARRAGFALLAMWFALLARGQAPALRPGLPVIQTPSRLVDVIDIHE